MRGVVSVGCVAGAAAAVLTVMVVMEVMEDAEVGGAGAAGGATGVDLLLGAGGGFDERGGGAGRRLGQTGAQRTLQLRDVISVLKGNTVQEEILQPTADCQQISEDFSYSFSTTKRRQTSKNPEYLIGKPVVLAVSWRRSRGKIILAFYF